MPEREQVAAGAGTVAWLSRTLVTFRALPEPLVPPGPAEGTEAQRRACLHPHASRWGWGHLSSPGCPHAPGMPARTRGAVRAAGGHSGGAWLWWGCYLSHCQPRGAARRGSPCTASLPWGTGHGFGSAVRPGAAGQPVHPRGPALAALPVRAGPSIRHAALSAGSLLSPRQ